MQLATEFAREETVRGDDFSWLYDYSPDPDRLSRLTASTKKVHDHMLDTRGMKARLMRTHQYPYDKKLRKKKKFKKAFKLEEPVLTRYSKTDRRE